MKFFHTFYDEEVLEKINFLKNIRLFRDIGEKDLIYILESLTERTYLKGETIFTEGDIGRALFIIASGKVALTVFDKETKKALLERGQLHKILEKEAWIFHEEFALAGSEQRLEEVLQKHIALLGERSDSSEPVLLSDGKQGRVDLLLHKAVQPRAGEYDYLVVELKRPSTKI